MGLDVALGLMILFGGVRGWFKGFLAQSIQIGGIIASVYLATPIRELVRPKIKSMLASVDPVVLEKLIWWGAVFLCYVLIRALASALINVTRRPPVPGVPADSRFGDRSAGFFFGLAKSAIVAAFLIAAMDEHAIKYLKSESWADEHVFQSYSLALSRKYRPAERIWTSEPVAHFVSYVRREGVDLRPARNEGESDSASNRTARRENRPSRELDMSGAKKPGAGVENPPDLEIDPEIERRIDRMREELGKIESDKSR